MSRRTSKGVFQLEIYKGTSAYSGIAIAKILYYHRGEYQIRQSIVDNVKKELDRLDNARTAVKNQLSLLSLHKRIEDYFKFKEL